MAEFAKAAGIITTYVLTAAANSEIAITAAVLAMILRKFAYVAAACLFLSIFLTAWVLVSAPLADEVRTLPIQSMTALVRFAAAMIWATPVWAIRRRFGKDPAPDQPSA